MSKTAAGIAAGVLGLFLLLTAGMMEMVADTPMEELPEDLQAVMGYLQEPPGTNTVDGITWMTPVNFAGVSSSFGWRIHPIYGDLRLHAGIDLSATQGTPIYAARDGTVRIAVYDSSAGNYVSIDHGDGYRSVYMHMVYYIVSAGDQVKQGQIIGYVGSTGDSTGPHLHFGIYYNANAVDPANYIDLSQQPDPPLPNSSPPPGEYAEVAFN